jgi:hypothetical protein
MRYRSSWRKLCHIPRPEGRGQVAPLGEARALVQDESRGSEDLTAQSMGLDARLGNARRTEQRRVAVLEHRTRKISEVLEVEREIVRLRSEIEQMEGARKRLTTRIDFATIALRLEEERHARGRRARMAALGAVAPSLAGAGLPSQELTTLLPLQLRDSNVIAERVA